MPKHQFYALETKVKAAQRYLDGAGIVSVARSLGIKNPTQVKTWAKWLKHHEFSRLESGSGRPNPQPQLSEVEQLRKALAEKEMELELLKKFQILEKRWCEKHS